MDNTFRIAFHSGDTSFEIESTDKSWVEEKEKQYLSRLTEAHLSKPKPHPAVQESKPSPATGNVTINEFYRKYVKGNNITKRPDIAVLFVYFLQRIQKAESIKSGDVARCFADVGYPNYNKLNVTDILNQGKKKALLNYVNNLWSLTITGEDFVVNLLTSDTK